MAILFHPKPGLILLCDFTPGFKEPEWKNKHFPEILKIAKNKRALLFYADESIISLIPYVGKTWTLPNKKPIVYVSRKRGQNIGVTAAVNQQGRICFELTKEKERFTAKVFIRFIKKCIEKILQDLSF